MEKKRRWGEMLWKCVNGVVDMRGGLQDAIVLRKSKRGWKHEGTWYAFVEGAWIQELLGHEAFQ